MGAPSFAQFAKGGRQSDCAMGLLIADNHVEGAGSVSPTFREKRERWGARVSQRYFMFMAGMGMSELKMSHWVFHTPFDFFDTSIHLPWSRWEPSAPVITYVPVP